MTSRKFRLESDPFVLLGAVGFIVVFVIGTIALGETAQVAFVDVADGLMANLGWFYIGGVSMVFIFLIVVFVSRFGRVKLGDD